MVESMDCILPPAASCSGASVESLSEGADLFEWLSTQEDRVHTSEKKNKHLTNMVNYFEQELI